MDKVLSVDGVTKLTQKVVEDATNKKYAPIISTKSISGGNIAVLVNGSAVPVAFGAQALSQLVVSNISGTGIEVKQDGAGVYFPIPTGTMMTFQGITDAAQLGIRRVDLAATPITISARWEK
jgi:sulfur carrier protein ThiS